jgi:hypothetical protein
MKKKPAAKKPAAKKPVAKKPAKVTFKEVVDTPDWETKEKDKSAVGKIRVTDKGTKYIVKNNKEVKMSVPPGLEFNKSYTPEEMREAMEKADKKSEEKEFGTPSSPKARHEGSEWIPNPDLDRSTGKYSQMSKRELEIVGRQYGVEVDRRLRRSTIIRIVELAEEAFRKEQAMMEDPFQKKLLQGIFVGIAIGFLMGVLFGYGLGVR